MKNLKFISVDLQKEFSSKEGKHYNPHENVDFIKKTLIPFLRENNIKIAEIISDYRQPRPGDLDDSTRPGEDGYLSEIPEDIKLENVWIKFIKSSIFIKINKKKKRKNF